ncbi:MAG TPA: hypothetical protein VK558_05540, partial [Patescibacteria group bacterium]|nr:hypothetical protein [Patescibacteria group bacterium]
MTATKALVTILIGDSYIAMWERLFASTWRAYCEKHGYDLIVIKEYIDKSDRALTRGPHWQKCLILEREEVRKYDRVVWVDADIAINFHNAPCIVDATPRHLIGAMHYNDMNCMTP